MNLNDLENKRYAQKALKENFEMEFDVSNLDKSKTRNMLSKVTSLIKESKQEPNFYKKQNSPAHMKLVFMEQALSDHYKKLALAPKPRIVVENEEVEKSQVILAAQDMVDSVQKMYEDVNDMLVKELPALVNSIQSEIGVNESTDFNTQASEALNSLNDMLQQTRTSLQSALGVVTGQGSDAFMPDEEVDVDADLGDGELDLDLDLDSDDGDDLDLPSEPFDDSDDLDLSGSVGRAKR
jgi:hypothetical protein